MRHCCVTGSGMGTGGLVAVSFQQRQFTCAAGQLTGSASSALSRLPACPPPHASPRPLPLLPSHILTARPLPCAGLSGKLVEILSETNQEVPAWLQNMAQVSQLLLTSGSL